MRSRKLKATGPEVQPHAAARTRGSERLASALPQSWHRKLRSRSRSAFHPGAPGPALPTRDFDAHSVTLLRRHPFFRRVRRVAPAGGGILQPRVVSRSASDLQVNRHDPDRAGFGELYDRLQPSLLRYLERLTGDLDLAEDVAQEAFLRLFRRGDLAGDDARLWIFTVATNLVRDHGRTSLRRQRLLVAQPVLPKALPGPDAETERRERVERVREALGQLAERDRQLLLMREEGFRYQEMADAVGVAPGSVGTLIARALKKFRTVYRGDEE